MGALSLTAAIRQRTLNFRLRLYLFLPFNPSHGDSFTSCMTPVETSTTPEYSVLRLPGMLTKSCAHSILAVSGAAVKGRGEISAGKIWSRRYGAKIWSPSYGTEDMKKLQALPEINSYKLCNETYLYN